MFVGDLIEVNVYVFEMFMYIVEQIGFFVENVYLWECFVIEVVDIERVWIGCDFYDSVIQFYIGLKFVIEVVQCCVVKDMLFVVDFDCLVMMVIEELVLMCEVISGLCGMLGKGGVLLLSVV